MLAGIANQSNLQNWPTMLHAIFSENFSFANMLMATDNQDNI